MNGVVVELVYNMKRYRFAVDPDLLYLSVGPDSIESYKPIDQVLYLVVFDGPFRLLCPVMQGDDSSVPIIEFEPHTIPKGKCICARRALNNPYPSIYLPIHEVN